MRLFRRRATDPATLTQQLSSARERSELLSHAALGFLYCIKELSLDVDEIGAEMLKRRLDELMADLRAEVAPAQLRDRLSERHDEILAFAASEKRYLDERESEFKKIIDVLTHGLSSIGNESTVFYSGMQQRSARFEQISQLDDLRRVRQELNSEVKELRQAVRDKQQQEATRLQSLQREVEVLQLDVESAKKEALRDGLTGAANRLALDRALASYVDRCQLGKEGFSVLLVDVDHFKRFNDTWGHQTGDRVLMGLVETCRSLVRPNDLVARFGGEEFAIVLPGAPLRAAMTKARLLCKTQAEKKYRSDDGRVVQFGVSIGVATHRAGDTPESILQRADAALYLAKKRGRGRAVKER